MIRANLNNIPEIRWPGLFRGEMQGAGWFQMGFSHLRQLRLREENKFGNAAVFNSKVLVLKHHATVGPSTSSHCMSLRHRFICAGCAEPKEAPRRGTTRKDL
jgi:hypothetical protein